MGLMSAGGKNSKTKMITFTNLAGYPNNISRLDYYENYEKVDSRTFNLSDSGQVFHFVKFVRTSDTVDLYAAATRVFSVSCPNVDDGYNGFRTNGALLSRIGWVQWAPKMTCVVLLVEE